MIEVKIISSPQKAWFQSYEELFEHLTRGENVKLLEPHPDFKSMNWSFTVFLPERIETILSNMKEQRPIIREAFEKKLPLIEICTGDFKNPQYISLTPDLNMAFLKKKWCLAYCTAHHMSVTENP